jgi:hypothetical protein
MATQVSLNSGAVASAGALALQTNGTTQAVSISTGQVATLAQNPILTSGTINGVAYLNGSNALTTGSALTYNGTSFGVGSSAYGDAGTITASIGVAGTTSGGLQLWATSAQEHYIQWGDGTTGTDTYRGAISYAHAGDFMRFWTSSAEQMRLTSTGLKTASTISVGNATPSTSGAGITFPATDSPSSNANTLDDYEEGLFVPTMSSGSGGPIVLSTATGKYTKIGNVVTFALRVTVSNANSAGGAISITNLPFASTSYANRNRVVSASISNVTGSTMDNIGGTFIPASSTQINIASSIFANIVLTNTSDMDFNGTYFV